MATKSILKTVHIKDASSARKLVNALENAQKLPKRKIRINRQVTVASREDIRSIFGVRK